jgi:hypothetical protein
MEVSTEIHPKSHRDGADAWRTSTEVEVVAAGMGVVHSEEAMPILQLCYFPTRNNASPKV